MTSPDGACQPSDGLTGAAQGRHPSRDLPLPVGFGVWLDPTTRQVGADVLVGGTPRRVLRLGGAGLVAWAELRGGVVRTSAGGRLARRLVDAGLAHPRPNAASTATVTVLIPVLDRAASLDACLSALGRAHPVLIVDDGSADPDAIAKVAAAHGARLVQRELNGGPAAARNFGLAQIDTELVAFLDSDCLPPPGWVAALAAHALDPAVGAVAPRIVAASADSPIGRYTRARAALDLGTRPGRVAPGAPVSYVPTAALVARRAALLEVAVDPAPDAALQSRAVFDPALRYGEDVDLIWRLHEGGWRVRYEPAVQVRHTEPDCWRALVGRRYRYGTSAAQLSVRHPGALAPLIVEPFSALTLVALFAGRPRIAAVVAGAAVLAERRVRAAAGVPDGAAGAVLERTGRSWRAAGAYATQFLAPALLVGLADRRTRPAALALLAAPPVATWRAARPVGRPWAFAAAHVAEDVAYGAGVIAGSARARTAEPLRPVRSRRSVRRPNKRS